MLIPRKDSLPGGLHKEDRQLELVADGNQVNDTAFAEAQIGGDAMLRFQAEDIRLLGVEQVANQLVP